MAKKSVFKHPLGTAIHFTRLYWAQGSLGSTRVRLIAPLVPRCLLSISFLYHWKALNEYWCREDGFVMLVHKLSLKLWTILSLKISIVSKLKVSGQLVCAFGTVGKPLMDECKFMGMAFVTFRAKVQKVLELSVKSPCLCCLWASVHPHIPSF
jgi:hypothetical protein